jgi:hypothetical protein
MRKGVNTSHSLVCNVLKKGCHHKPLLFKVKDSIKRVIKINLAPIGVSVVYSDRELIQLKQLIEREIVNILEEMQRQYSHFDIDETDNVEVLLHFMSELAERIKPFYRGILEKIISEQGPENYEEEIAAIDDCVNIQIFGDESDFGGQLSEEDRKNLESKNVFPCTLEEGQERLMVNKLYSEDEEKDKRAFPWMGTIVALNVEDAPYFNLFEPTRELLPEYAANPNPFIRIKTKNLFNYIINFII